MNTSPMALDLSVLPESVRIQLMDFYDFLLTKYVAQPQLQEVKKHRFARFLNEPIKVKQVQTFTREELHER